MILVDTSVWVDHLRRGDAELAGALEAGTVLAHPWVLGELALGGLRAQTAARVLITRLPQATVASHDEVVALIDGADLAGSGIGYVDAHLLAATRLSRDAVLWTRDGRLSRVAVTLGVGHRPGGRGRSGRPGR